MKSHEGGLHLLSRSRPRTPMTVCGLICFALLSVMFKQQQAALSLNVDVAKEALSAPGNEKGGYTEMHAPGTEGDQEHVDAADLKDAESGGAMQSFLDNEEEPDDSDDSDTAEEDDEHSFLEDADDENDEEDYDLDAVDEEDAKAIADTLSTGYREAFLQRWEAHKANRKANGDPDPRGSFAEF